MKKIKGLGKILMLVAILALLSAIALVNVEATDGSQKVNVSAGGTLKNTGVFAVRASQNVTAEGAMFYLDGNVTVKATVENINVAKIGTKYQTTLKGEADVLKGPALGTFDYEMLLGPGNLVVLNILGVPYSVSSSLQAGAICIKISTATSTVNSCTSASGGSSSSYSSSTSSSSSSSIVISN